jgi:molybdopterin molybdotransferase
VKTLDQIASELEGYDPQALRADVVGAFLLQMVEPVNGIEQVDIFAALGRVLAADMVSPLNVPPHDNSAMDGYAFDGHELALAAETGFDLVLESVGTAYAGQAWRGQVAPGQCVKVMTGAIMPSGLDTVVPQEFTTVDGRRIRFSAKNLSAGANRRLTGEDIRQGQVALTGGTRLTPAALGLLASLGMPAAPVRRKLKVAYFSTGDEVLSLGDPEREGAVYDSNRYTVFGLLTRLGVEILDLGVVRDEPTLLEAAFRHAAMQADAIITSGGVSVGEADHTKAMMKKLAADAGGVAFWRVAMRPGRPMAVGRIARPGPDGAAILFGLPGNPVAVMVTFLAFVRPALMRMMGCQAETQPLLKACSAGPIRKRPGRTEYQRGTVAALPDGQLQVTLIGNQGSGVLSSMVQANGLVVLHHDQGNVAAGETVDVMMFEGVT